MPQTLKQLDRLRTVAAVALVCIGVLTLVAGVVRTARDERDHTASAVRAGAQQLYDWDVCIERQIRERIPRGARVRVLPQDSYWSQGLPGLLLPWARPVRAHAGARYQVWVKASEKPDEPGEWCGTRDPAQPFPRNMRVELIVDRVP